MNNIYKSFNGVRVLMNRKDVTKNLNKKYKQLIGTPKVEEEGFSIEDRLQVLIDYSKLIEKNT